MSARVPALSILLEQYPQQLRISLAATSRWIGIKEGTARNWLSAGTFPISTVLSGDRRLVDIRDLAEYLDRRSAQTPVSNVTENQTTPTANPTKRGRGRPRKLEGVK